MNSSNKRASYSNYIFYEIERDSPTIHKVLVRLSSIFWESAVVAIETDECHNLNLKEATDRGFIKIENETVSFRDIEVLKSYILQHAIEQFLTVWVNGEMLLEQYWKLSKFQIKGSFEFNVTAFENIESEALLLLSREHRKDVSELIISISNLRGHPNYGRSFQRLYDSYWVALPEIKHTAENVISILDSMGSNFLGLSLRPQSAIRTLSEDDDEYAEELYRAFLSKPKMHSTSLVFYVLEAMSKENITEAHSRALSLSKGQEKTLQTAGVRALGAFDYRTHAREDLLSLTIDRLENLISGSNIDIASFIVSACEKLVSQTDKACEILIELAESSSSSFRRACLSSLFCLAKTKFSEDWYKQAICNIVEVHHFNEEELSYLDHCLEQYDSEDFAFVMSMLEKIRVSTTLDVRLQSKSIVEALSSVLAKLARKQLPDLESALTQWIASSNQKLHILAFEINSSFRAIPVKVGHTLERNRSISFKLSRDVLSTLSDETVRYVAHRVLAYSSVDVVSMCTFLLSILQKDCVSKELVSLVTELLRGYVLFNYPTEAQEFISAQIKENKLSRLQKKVAETSVMELQSYVGKIQALPPLKEFSTPADRTYLYRLAQQRQQKKLQDESEAQSTLSQFFPKRLFSYGKTVSWEEDKSFVAPRPLIPVSISAEMPRGEFIDPVGQARSRFIWMTEGVIDSGSHSEQIYSEEKE